MTPPAFMAAPAKSKTIFFDDFGLGRLDRSKWNVRTTGKVVNDEQQAYVDTGETVYVEPGADHSVDGNVLGCCKAVDEHADKHQKAYLLRGAFDENKRQQRERQAELCAKHKLMVNFHDGPLPPTGAPERSATPTTSASTS